MIEMADLFVEERKVAVMVPDLYRGTSSTHDNLLVNIMLASNTPQKRADLDMDAALAWALEQDEVDATRVLSGPGFCFGGAQALVFSTRHNVSATIMLYGSNIAAMADAPDEDWGLLGEGDTVLGIYGATDTRPSPAHVKAFEKRLDKRNITKEIKIYDGVGHAFVKKEAIDDPDLDGGAAKAAWEQVLAYFDSLPARRLQPASIARPTGRTNHWGRFAGILANGCAGE